MLSTHERLDSGRDWRGGPRRGSAAVVCHVCPDKVSCGESTAEAQLSGKDCSCDDASQLLRVLARMSRVGSSNTKHLEHCRLCFKDRASSDRADLDRRHRHANLKVVVDAIKTKLAH